MARVLLVGGGCPGVELARALTRAGYAVRITTRSRDRREEIEAAGAEHWLGSPARLATLRSALDQVTIVCWLLAGARGAKEELWALHESRLESFLGQAIDTTVRGFVYDASRGVVPSEILTAGALATSRIAALNAIPHEVIAADLCDREAWLSKALAAVQRLLGSSPGLRYPDS